MTRQAALLLCCAGLASGCAVPRVVATPAPASAAIPASPAVILAIRPQAPAAQRQDVLAALGDAAPLPPAHPGPCDVTLRLDDGRLVSVVAPSPARLRVGSRIALAAGGRLIDPVHP